MFNIAIYLNKFKSLESKDSVLRGIVISSINKVLGVNIDKKMIKIRKNGVVCVEVDSVLKSEIFLNKIKIVNEFKNQNIHIKNII